MATDEDKKKSKKSSKKRIIIFAVVAVLIAAIALGGYYWFGHPAMFRSLKDNSLDENSVSVLIEDLNQKEELNILVAYYSYSGTTEGAAKKIQEYTGADIFEITLKDSYEDVYMDSRSEIQKGERPEMGSNLTDVAKYDVVFVGYPVWWHAVPAVINTFLESYDFSGKLIIPFCTSSETDISETMPTFLDACDGLALYGQRRFAAGEGVEEWLNSLSIKFKK